MISAFEKFVEYNTTRKQSWIVMVVALLMWITVGIYLMINGVMKNVAVFAAYFGLITTVILPSGYAAYKSYKEKKNGLVVTGEVKPTE